MAEEPIQITQADTDAAEDFMLSYAATEPYLGRHRDQTAILVQAFARHRLAAQSPTEGEADVSMSPPEAGVRTYWPSDETTTHLYNPHPKFPWFCDDCGYPEHERLKHPATERK